MSEYTYLSAGQLAERIPFSRRYIIEVLKDRDLIEGVHYVRPFGGRKVVFLWEPIERLVLTEAPKEEGGAGIPLAAGGVCHG